MFFSLQIIRVVYGLAQSSVKLGPWLFFSSGVEEFGVCADWVTDDFFVIVGLLTLQCFSFCLI